MAAGIVIHERMNEADNRKTWAGRIADRCPATVGVPAKDPAGEMQAPHRVRTCGQLHAARWHLEDVRSARRIEHIRPFEEACEHLAIPAIADEAEASARRNFVRDAAHMAAPAAKREFPKGLSHQSRMVTHDPVRCDAKPGNALAQSNR